MRNRRNYYRILHVQPDAPAEVIRSSYRAIMLQLEMHPDRGGDHWNAALINEAYAALSDPGRREEYDRGLRQSRFRREASGAEPSVEPVPEPAEASAAEPCVFCLCPIAPGAGESPEDRCARCGSPLFPAARFASAACGKRAASRLEQRRRVRVFTDWPQAGPVECEARDVSPRGLRLETATPLRKYQVVKVDARELQAVGRVAYCRPSATRGGSTWTVGIEFFTVLVEPGSFVSCNA